MPSLIRRPGTGRPGRAACVAAVLAGLLLAVPAAWAGRSCESRPLTPSALERGLTLAGRLAQSLEVEHARSGTRVVLIARAGQDLSRYGLRYSHLGYAYRNADGVWRVVHKLNQCGTATASLYRQGLGEFFLDDLWRQEAVWQVPTPVVQDRLHAVLTDAHQVTRLHARPYSMVSYAWGRTYQQSNQWAIEVLAQAMDDSVYSREQAQAWLRARGYQPTSLRLGALTRLGARMTAANVAFDDHPSAQRFADRIDTVTVDSVFAWTQRAGLAGSLQVIR